MTKLLNITMILAAALFAASFSGISNAENAASSSAVSQRSDHDINTSVEARFSDDAAFKNIDVDTDNGIVTLSGTVPTQADADRAVAAAESVKDVKSVNSELKVGKESSTSQKMDQLEEKTKTTLHKAGVALEDTKITAAVKLKFADDDAVKATKIDVDTNNGIVTLSGTVASRAEADRAVEIARGVDGVKEVHSKLIVRS